MMPNQEKLAGEIDGLSISLRRPEFVARVALDPLGDAWPIIDFTLPKAK
jgi:hypothetical protein